MNYIVLLLYQKNLTNKRTSDTTYTDTHTVSETDIWKYVNNISGIAGFLKGKRKKNLLKKQQKKNNIVCGSGWLNTGV